MLHAMITKKRDEWLDSDTCTVKALVSYIEQRDQMRDAQVEAIKTYLFLKIACHNAPLWKLFAEGHFTSLSVDTLEIRPAVASFLIDTPAAIALFEYVTLTNDADEKVSAQVEALIRSGEETIDYTAVWKKLFGVSYADYLFSLPMGAGKTFLMAAFIYLDLYFAIAEPENPAFAHNFIIFAPSGLKTSVVPSLRTIEKFDPSWIIPEPAASAVKRMIRFEVLDAQKAERKSNKAKNPNVQKIANYQPFSDLMGLVAVTNAEKVILDYVNVENGVIKLFESDDAKPANELRERIGLIPNLAIFVDEVHHVADGEIKLRAVINHWMDAAGAAINNVIGFSGTPYRDGAAPVPIGSVSVRMSELPNVVYYYPLLRGINNFLKGPAVHASNTPDGMQIVERGVREFLDEYGNTVYADGLTAKLAIYCGLIATLEEQFLPLVRGIVAEYGLDPNEVILKYYGSDSKGKYVCPAENATEFALLNSPTSKKRIILLVQIGKEGWDCPSLTGVILSQKGDCPTTMVLQTACRCLRQVDKGQFETAGIWLNSYNADTLDKQLRQQQHITLQQLSSVPKPTLTDIFRYDRRKHLHLPAMDYYRLHVRYDRAKDRVPQTDADLATTTAHTQTVYETVDRTLDHHVLGIRTDEVAADEAVTYLQWLYLICKESFGGVSMEQLQMYDTRLREIFAEISISRNGVTFLRSDYDHALIRSRIRVAFLPKSDYVTREEAIKETASLLHIEKLTSPVQAVKPTDYYPAQADVQKILNADKGKAVMDASTQEMIRQLEASGDADLAQRLRERYEPLPEREQTYHYVPYNFGQSDFEKKFFARQVQDRAFRDSNLELYYNGDRALTDFHIRCYKGNAGHWRYIGMYTPDFLLLQRKDGEIHKAIIIETKGKGYANDPMFLNKRHFMETEFKRLNREQFGYERFEYLYLEEGTGDSLAVAKALDTARRFLGET